MLLLGTRSSQKSGSTARGQTLTVQHHSRDKVISDAEEFARTHELAEHSDLFVRAALVARDQRNFAQVVELTEDERYALLYERDHKWHGSKMMWFSISLCAIGAATQGLFASGLLYTVSNRAQPWGRGRWSRLPQRLEALAACTGCWHNEQVTGSA
jgi:hypothetical protein